MKKLIEYKGFVFEVNVVHDVKLRYSCFNKIETALFKAPDGFSGNYSMSYHVDDNDLIQRIKLIEEKLCEWVDEKLCVHEENTKLIQELINMGYEK